MLITNIKFIAQNIYCINKPAYLQRVSDPVFIKTLVKLRHPAFSCILQLNGIHFAYLYILCKFPFVSHRQAVHLYLLMKMDVGLPKHVL